jgi:16S rRNA (adenine1518-N6/adenine1519-N6)-dimethyltransferase
VGSLLGGGDVRALAAELDIRPTKKWGQNFVTDPNTVERIVRAADLAPDDVVLEVGPGLGSLTLALVPHCAAVVAVEIDPVLAGRLPLTVHEHAPEFESRLTVVQADALQVDVASLTASGSASPPTALVANLPYNVAVPVVLHLLESVPSLRTVLVMVQKEVADRLAAGPGSRVYGVPSVKARWYGDVSSAGSVGTQVFWPVPHVESGLVRIVRHEPPTTRAGRESVFAVIDAAFAQRRKTLRSTLAGLAGSPVLAEQVLQSAGVDPGLRGEALALGDFVRIADVLHDRASDDATA